MSASRVLSAALGLSLFAGISGAAQTAQPWSKIPIPALHAFNPKQPKRVELPNGLVIFLEEDH